jgi:RES domain-containing protein
MSGAEVAAAIDREPLLERLERLRAREWRGLVYRHVLGRQPPASRNHCGARWNPRGLSALYASLERDTALAEAEPTRSRSKRTIYGLLVDLGQVVDLRDRGLLAELGVADAADRSASQRLGAAVARLGHDGLLVPSARAAGTNLVMFPHRHEEFEIVSIEILGGEDER